MYTVATTTNRQQTKKNGILIYLKQITGTKYKDQVAVSTVV